MLNKLLCLSACCSLLTVPSFAEEQLPEVLKLQTEEEQVVVKGTDSEEPESLLVRCPCGKDGKHKHMQSVVKDEEQESSALLADLDGKVLEELTAEEEEQHFVSVEKKTDELFHHDNEQEHEQALTCCSTEEEKDLI
jgi:hypothetical protein